MKKKRYLYLCAFLLIIATGSYILYTQEKQSPDTSPAIKSEVTLDSERTNTDGDEDKKPVEDTDSGETKDELKYPVTLAANQASLITVVVNKKHKLPDSYYPELVSVAGGNMRQEAADELQKMLEDAQASGHTLKILSSFRSYNTQVSTYNGYVNQYGQAKADTFSARPGHSEHQTGLAVDLGNSDGSCTFEICFGSTASGAWLAENGQDYGFIVRYPKGLESETGYQYEPWHLRFVGVDLAKSIVESKKTLDQYFDIPAGTY